MQGLFPLFSPGEGAPARGRTGSPLVAPLNRALGAGFWLLAHIAQLVEHILGKDEVIGSIPIVGSRKRQHPAAGKSEHARRDSEKKKPPQQPTDALNGRPCRFYQRP